MNIRVWWEIHEFRFARGWIEAEGLSGVYQHLMFAEEDWQLCDLSNRKDKKFRLVKVIETTEIEELKTN